MLRNLIGGLFLSALLLLNCFQKLQASENNGLWDYSKITLYLTLPVPDRVTAVATAPDGNTFAAGTKGHVILFNTKGKQIEDLEFTDADISAQNKEMQDNPLQGAAPIELWVNRLVFSPNSSVVAAAAPSSGIRVWDAATGDLRFSLAGHSNGTTCLAFSPDNRYLASGGNDSFLRIWSVADGTLLKEWKEHVHPVISLAWKSDSSILTMAARTPGDENTELRTWNFSNTPADGPTGQFSFGETDPKTAVLSSQGSIIVSKSIYNKERERKSPRSSPAPIIAWSAATLEQSTPPKIRYYFDLPINLIALSPNSRTVAVTGVKKSPSPVPGKDYVTGTLGFWDIRTQTPADFVRINPVTGLREGSTSTSFFTRYVSAIAFSPNGRAVLLGCDKLLEIWAVP